MKRSEAIKLLIPKVISPFEVLKQEHYENGEYQRRAEALLTFIEQELGMVPPEIQSNIYLRSECAYAMVNEWEPEDGQRT